MRRTQVPHEASARRSVLYELLDRLVNWRGTRLESVRELASETS